MTFAWPKTCLRNKIKAFKGGGYISSNSGMGIYYIRHRDFQNYGRVISRLWTRTLKSKDKMMSTSQKRMVEINKLIGKGCNRTHWKRKVCLTNCLLFKIWWNKLTNTVFENP